MVSDPPKKRFGAKADGIQDDVKAIMEALLGLRH